MFNLNILTTNQCNLSCSWCQRKDFLLAPTDFLSDQDYTNIILQNIQTHSFENVSFSGGEPLLRLEFLLSTISKIKEIYPKIAIVLVTNGLLMTSNIAAFLNYYDVAVILSCEGLSNKDKNLSMLSSEAIKSLRSINKLEINKLMFPNISFVPNIVEISSIFACPFQLALDTTKKYDISDILYIQSELYKLVNFKTQISISKTMEVCQTKPCVDLYPTGKLIQYDCDSISDWAGCPEIYNMMDSRDTLDYFITVVNNFKQGWL